jgi:hypothetical protein
MRSDEDKADHRGMDRHLSLEEHINLQRMDFENALLVQGELDGHLRLEEKNR